MEIDINKKQLMQIILSLKSDLSEKQTNAERVNMCLREDFVISRNELINKLNDALSQSSEVKKNE